MKKSKKKTLIPKPIIKLKREILSFLTNDSRARRTSNFSKNPHVLNCMIAYNDYGGYCTPISSQKRPAVQKILKGLTHEPETVKFILENAKDGDVIHAGTFFGDFLPPLSQGINKSAKIWAFEPNPENFKCAELTILINNIKNVELTFAGLGEMEETKKILVKTNSGRVLGGGSRIIDSDQNGITEETKVLSIDSAVPQNRVVSIIQLDVEGYEEQALKGAIKTIQRCNPILILEDQNNVVSKNWFKENILNQGYEKIGFVHHNTIFKIKS